MARLTEPDPRYRVSYLGSCAEPEAGWRARLDVTSLSHPAAFDTYCRALRTGSFAWQHTQAGGRMRMLWWCEGDDWLGEATIRPDVPPQLRSEPEDWPPVGHIGYQVRVSARRQGHGRALFSAALEAACGMGLEVVTLTVDAANQASIRIVESCGAVLTSTERGYRLYLARTRR